MINNTEPTAIDLAAYAYLQAKSAEENARNARLETENQLIELIGLAGDEGTMTKKSAYYKVSTVAGLTRSINLERLDEVSQHVDQDTFYSVFKTEWKLSVSALKKLATSDPDAYRALSGAVIAKPAKTTVKVEAIAIAEEAA